MCGNLNKILRVAFPFKKNNTFLSGKHFDNTYYNFFMKALKRNKKISITYFPADEKFDTSILKKKFDIILLWSNNEWGTPELENIEQSHIPVIARGGDPKMAEKSAKNHKKWKIDHYFHFFSEDFFYQRYPKNFKYKTILFGLEPEIYQDLTSFKDRIKNKILVSGLIGNTKFISRIINDIRNPKWNSLRCKYLRTMSAKLPYVDYDSVLQTKYVNDKYPLLLSKYRASIAADTYTPVIKYWESAGAGCLTFMEISKKNKGEYIGFRDYETAIFINEKNYQEKFEEFLNDPDNPKWENIANAGRKYALEEVNNDKAVESLVKLMEDLL